MKNPLILSLHRYIGLATAVFFLVTAVTGGLLLYQDAILYGYYPALEEARESAQQAEPGSDLELLGKLWEVHEQRPILRVRYPDDDWPFYNIGYADGSSAYFSPEGEAVVESQGFDNPVHLIFAIHHDWLLGHWGELASGYLHLLVMLLIGTGIYAWWPRRWRKSLHLVLRGSAVKISYSWHRVLGVVSAITLIVAVGTGIMMVFYTPVQSVLTGLFGGESHSVSRVLASETLSETEPETGPGMQRSAWPPLHRAISETLPEGEVRLISFPQEANDALVVRKRMPGEWHQNGRSFIHINPYNSEVYSARNAMDEELGIRLTHKIYPLHSAGVGDTLYVTFLAVAGFTPLVLVPTGIYVWWWRRRRRIATQSAMPSKDK